MYQGNWIFLFMILNTRLLQSYAQDIGDIRSLDKIQTETADRMNFEHVSLISSLSHVTSGGILDLAERYLQQKLLVSALNLNVSSDCLHHTEIFLLALRSGEKWAVRMFDSIGKPGSGILDGDVKWLGSFDECFATKAKVNISGVMRSPFSGQYCTTSFKVDFQQKIGDIDVGSTNVQIGTCFPDSCDDKDVEHLLDTLLTLMPSNISFPEPKVTCLNETEELDTKAIVAIIICSVFGLVMTLATVYDVIVINWTKPKMEVLPQNEVFHTKYRATTEEESGRTKQYQDSTVVTNDKNVVISNGELNHTETEHKKKSRTYQPGRLGQLLLSFSIYTNTSKMFNTYQPSGTLGAINGIRFISMTWVIMGHGFQATISVASNMASFGSKLLKRFTFQAIANGYVSVDTFFTLSGLLVAYLSLKEMKKRGGAKKFKWGMFYFHRFWRLTPPYMLFLMFYACLTKHLSNGPLWADATSRVDDCPTEWWHNFLYINNIVKTGKSCMGWGWYLANDMQFFIVSPLMLIPLYYSSLLGILSCLCFVLTTLISVGVISSQNDLNAVLSDNKGHQDAIVEIYDRPWCRVGPYAVGVFAGYLLYKTDCKLKIPKMVNIVGWLLAVAAGISVVYGLYDPSGIPRFSTEISALYNAAHRTAWGAAVSWVIVACATGNGGFVNTLLSWKPLIPLARLTYCAYLVHPVVLLVYFFSKRSLVYTTDLENAFLFCGYLCISYAVAFIVSLSFEAPMMGLEKALLGRGKNS